ncbi:MAG: quinone-dependent dihydroorotate dehydrogenase [Gammaproteobacteria bacterium]|nr:quinone-dependent dihydroorotate dehydrogenase [Gammaproteobacteria bacterium]
MKNIYRTIRPILFTCPAETTHHMALKLLDWQAILFNKYPEWASQKPIRVSGLSFSNPVGLAAGFDNHAAHLPALFHFGFGFIEVGAITPRAQAGNAKPRLFRLPAQESLLNRMGFCNQGVDYLVENLKNRPKGHIVGVNIGKNSDTPLENALQDYLYCFNKVAPFCDYVTVNISSPNTMGLRQLQQGDYCRHLLEGLKKAQSEYAQQANRYVPLWVKVAPDLSQEEIKVLADIFCALRMDGIVATNTTIQRDNVPVAWRNEAGGISGKALNARADAILASFYAAVGEAIPLIGVGGIFSVADAKRKQQAGAKLLQLYSGLIYEGPGLIKELVTGL